MVFSLLFLALTLPADVSMHIRLETILDSTQAKVGDPIVGVLVKDAKLKGKIVLPKKTIVRGHIRLLDLAKDRVTIGLELEEAESPDTKAKFAANLEEIVSTLPGMGHFEHGSLNRSSPNAQDVSATDPILPNNSPGLGTFFVLGSKFKLRDLEMVWRTLPAN